MAGQAYIGWSNSLGWYEGFSLLTSVDPTGVITGLCFGSASTSDQHLAETFLAVRAQPNERLISVGSICWGPYIAHKGFEGAENHRPAGKRATGHPLSATPVNGGQSLRAPALFVLFELRVSGMIAFAVCGYRHGWRRTENVR